MPPRLPPKSTRWRHLPRVRKQESPMPSQFKPPLVAPLPPHSTVGDGEIRLLSTSHKLEPSSVRSSTSQIPPSETARLISTFRKSVTFAVNVLVFLHACLFVCCCTTMSNEWSKQDIVAMTYERSKQDIIVYGPNNWDTPISQPPRITNMKEAVAEYPSMSQEAPYAMQRQLGLPHAAPNPDATPPLPPRGIPHSHVLNWDTPISEPSHSTNKDTLAADDVPPLSRQYRGTPHRHTFLWDISISRSNAPKRGHSATTVTPSDPVVTPGKDRPTAESPLPASTMYFALAAYDRLPEEAQKHPLPLHPILDILKFVRLQLVDAPAPSPERKRNRAEPAPSEPVAPKQVTMLITPKAERIPDPAPLVVSIPPNKATPNASAELDAPADDEGFTIDDAQCIHDTGYDYDDNVRVNDEWPYEEWPYEEVLLLHLEHILEKYFSDRHKWEHDYISSYYRQQFCLDSPRGIVQLPGGNLRCFV